MLEIESSTYYGWVRQAEHPCDRELVDLGLLSNIYDIWAASGGTYGADRVLKIPKTWPWTEAFILCWQRLTALPAPT